MWKMDFSQNGYSANSRVSDCGHYLAFIALVLDLERAHQDPVKSFSLDPLGRLSVLSCSGGLW